MAHAHAHLDREGDRRALRLALAIIGTFTALEVAAGILASSLAVLADAAHMLTDAGALTMSLIAARLATRPAGGSMTYGLGRSEILSAQANGITLLVLALLIVYDAIVRLVSPQSVTASVVLAVAVVGAAVNLIAARVLAGDAQRQRSLNVEGSYQHLVTDLYGFLATGVAAIVILATGFDRADPIASLMIAALMLRSASGLLKDSGRVFMEAAPAGLDPGRIGSVLASRPGVVEVHDLHVWEVTSGFPALSAHVTVQSGADCHELRRELQLMLAERFDLRHTTLQVDHEAAPQPPLQIEVADVDSTRR